MRVFWKLPALSTSTCTKPVPLRGAGEQRRCPTLAFAFARTLPMLQQVHVLAGKHELATQIIDGGRCDHDTVIALRQQAGDGMSRVQVSRRTPRPETRRKTLGS